MRAALRLLAAALFVTSAPAIGAPAHRVARPDWTRSFSVTAEGGYRVGNRQAKLVVVEYGSLTCPHCRHFAETAIGPLFDRYVRTGKASYEFRPFVLNEVDMSATLLARCGGPSRFFPIMAELYATQPSWASKFEKLSQDEQDKIGALSVGQTNLAIAKVSGLFAVGAAHGIPLAKARQCVGDEAAAEALAGIEQAGRDLGVKGTPTIFVNGKQVPAYDWNTLEPFLKSGGA